jgi:hypothetical protein
MQNPAAREPHRPAELECEPTRGGKSYARIAEIGVELIDRGNRT